MSTVLPVGTRALSRTFNHMMGVIEEAPDRPDGIYVLRLDPDIGHFRSTILVQADEIAEERQFAIEEAERQLKSALDRRKAAAQRRAWAQSEERKATKAVTEARRVLRDAQRAASALTRKQQR